MIDQCADEGHVVDVLLSGRSAAVAGVPGPQVLVAHHPADPVGIDDDEAVLVGDRVETGVGLELPPRPEASVETDHERRRAIGHGDRIVDVVAP